MQQNDLAYRLRQSRHDKHITQMEACTAALVTAPTLSKWERGITIPHADALMRLSDLYGVTMDWLMRGDSK